MMTPAVASTRKGSPQALEIAMPQMRRIADNAWLGQLTPEVWVHTTTHVISVGYYPANGAIVTHAGEALLIDTGWNDADAAVILNEWKRLGQPPIKRALVTHFHNDRLGGIRELTRRGIPAFGNPLTIGLAVDAGSAPPRPLHGVQKQAVRLGGVEVFWPGAGHTIDNVVAWVPGAKVLFGGCLVKATTAPDLGYMADGDLQAYPTTIRRVAHAYEPSVVIPGHGTLSGDALAHTAALAKAAIPA